jgi:hypothetical protein
MGVASYARGNAVISRQCAERDRNPAYLMMDELNALAKYPGSSAPFGPVNLVQGNGGWWAECPVTGFGYWYKTLREAVRNWRIIVTGYDETTGVWTAVPMGRPGLPRT